MSSNPQIAAVNAAVGECLGAWTRVEVEISTLFMVIHSRSWEEFTHPLRAAFEAVISLEARLAMIRASVGADTDLCDSYGGHFNSLHNKVMKSYKKRHEIAHFMPVGRAKDNATIFGIKPFFTWATFENETGKSELYLTQINDRRDGFYQLVDRVQQHVQHVAGKKGLPAGYFARAGDPVHPDLDSDDPIPEDM